ncbi:hypothetical protein XPA_007759 [Xanthoria parietina]
MSGRPSLLTLPREIRDEIYTLLLNSSNVPPTSPEETGLRYREAVEDDVFSHRNVFYPPPTTWKGHTSALLQCNRQLRQEIVDATASARLQQGGTCKLDVMLKGCMLWPTWTKLLHPTGKMEHLEVNLRLFDVNGGGGLFWGCGGPGLTFVVLFRLLNRLLHHGPRFLYDERDNQSLEIQTLTLNVLRGSGEMLGPNDRPFEDLEDPAVKLKRRLEHEYKKIYQYICSSVGQVVRAGLLTDKIQTLEVCYGDAVTLFATDDIAPRTTPSDEWEEWGFVWGVDEGMKVEKVNSPALRNAFIAAT